MKHVSEVIVYKNDKPSSGHMVSLEFTSLFNGGFTGKFFTDKNGVAHVEHASTGEVNVYIDGNHSSHGTSGHVPGRIYVNL